VFTFGMQVVKSKKLLRSFRISLLESEPLSNIEDEIHLKEVEL